MVKNRRGQSTAEYAVVISVVIAVIVGMQLYVKRGVQGKFKHVADSYTQRGNADLVGGSHLRQYEPYYTGDSAYEIATDNTMVEKQTPGGRIEKTGINEETTRTGESVSGSDFGTDDLWK